MNKIFWQLYEACLDILYPRQCCHCEKVGEFLCNSCLAGLEFQLLQPQLKLQYVDQLLVCFQFTGAVRSVVKTAKYKSVIGVCELLAEFLFFYLNFPKVDYLIPVPMTQKKKSLRGFNQTEEMVKHLVEFSKINGVNALAKKSGTKNQASIQDHQERRKNVIGSFELLDGSEILRGKKVVLIDDVVTTGATMDECARVLKLAGVGKVYGVVVAHGG